MRVGVYLGSWRLMQLGGMGVYLQSLLQAVERACSSQSEAETLALDTPLSASTSSWAFTERDPRDTNASFEIVLLADRCNRDAAAELGVSAPLIALDRPAWSEIPSCDRRRVIATRALSYRDLDAADARRNERWSGAAEQYLWGLDEAVAAAEIDLLYFTIPPYLKRPRVPALLSIHDVKHLHRPQDHDASDLARRRRWRRVAQSAALVYASFPHVVHDLIEHYELSPSRTAVLPLAAPDCSLRVDESASAAPPPGGEFALLPAQLWVHKNHSLVLLALAHLRREERLDIPLICTGQTEGECAAHAERMRQLALKLGVSDLVQFRGHVPRTTLLSLYRAARVVVVASLYEAGSIPAMEALAMGKPLVASRVTSIPDTVGDAALLFDPTSVTDLAAALKRAWTDAPLRKALSERGPIQIADRCWEDVAREWKTLCSRAQQSADYPRLLVSPAQLS